MIVPAQQRVLLVIESGRRGVEISLLALGSIGCDGATRSVWWSNRAEARGD